MPKFSLIIPVYNVDLYIRRCLDSIQEQTYTDFEVIIVDDGSTDSSGSICRELCSRDNRFSYHYQKNSGQGPARNHGIDNSTGDYILFIDSDDWVSSTLLQCCSDLLSNSEIDFLNFRFDFITNHNVVKKIARRFSMPIMRGDGIFFSSMVEDNIFSVVWNKAYKRSLIIENNIRFPDIRAIEDLYFTRMVSKYSNCAVFINEVLYHALIRDGSSSRTMDIKSFQDALKLLDLERQTLIDSFNSREVSFFNAHVLKFLTYLIVQAAYRIPNFTLFAKCADLIYNYSCYKVALQSNSVYLLPLKNRFLIRISRYPIALRFFAKIMNFFGKKPY
jgi:glycosyltransferase involved in cell wall biosynthesis